VRTHTDWATLKRLLPYLWQYKWRVFFALAFMVGTVTVRVPSLRRSATATYGPIGACRTYGCSYVAVITFAACASPADRGRRYSIHTVRTAG